MKLTALGLLGALGLGLASLAGVASCTEDAKGQIMIAFQTDMSLPKDIDAIRVVVNRAGFVVYDQTFEKLGQDDSIHLPATLGFLAPEQPGQPVSIRMIATRGGEGSVRVLREVTTTVPVDRVVTLPITIQFLCDGSGAAELGMDGKPKLDSGGKVMVKNNCPDGQTCVDGACAPAAVDSSTLKEYSPEEIFGGGSGDGDGSCFDVGACFSDNALAAFDPAVIDDAAAPCSFDAPEGVNVALLTEGDGICGATGCYVALDAEAVAPAAGKITVPRAVCDQLKEGKLLGVVTSPVKESCGRKTTGLPTCGPWSSAGTSGGGGPSGDPKPEVIAQLQDHPVSLVLSANNVYWTTGGTWTDPTKDMDPMNDGDPVVKNADGTVRTTSLIGGPVQAIIGGLLSPRDIALSEDATFVVWANADPNGAAKGAIMRAQLPLSADTISEVVSGRDRPEGIAVRGGEVYWTELPAAGSPDGSVWWSGNPESIVTSKNPFRVRVDKGAVYWTDQGSPLIEGMPGDGSVVRFTGGSATPLASGEDSPRALTLDIDPATGEAVAVYWANFGLKGKDGYTGQIVRFELAGSARDVLAMGQAFPNGIAVDAERVYWTNRGAGTVMWRSKKGEETGELVAGQDNPGAIAVNEDAVYWINEGSSEVSNGKVMRLLKPKPAAAP